MDIIPNDIELAQIKATMRKLADAIDGMEHAVALTAIETFAASTLAMVDADSKLVDGFCDGLKRGVRRMRAAMDGKATP